MVLSCPSRGSADFRNYLYLQLSLSVDDLDCTILLELDYGFATFVDDFNDALFFVQSAGEFAVSVADVLHLVDSPFLGDISCGFALHAFLRIYRYLS